MHIKLNPINVLKCNNAQVFVEFMLIFPLFIILVFGIIEFSLLSLAHQNVAYAAHNAARSEIVGRPPHRSAWMTLFMLTPHWVQGISPFDAFKIQFPDFDEFTLSIDNKFKLINWAMGSPCLTEIFGLEDPFFEFDVEFTLFGQTVKNIEDFVSGLVNGILGDVSNLFQNALDDYVNNNISDAGYNMPPIIRQLFYAMSFTKVITKESGDAKAPLNTATVTYFYVLKFPVIQSIVNFFYKHWDMGSAGTIMKYKANNWSMAKEFSNKSGLTFVPITHLCTMGDEKRITVDSVLNN